MRPGLSGSCAAVVAVVASFLSGPPWCQEAPPPPGSPPASVDTSPKKPALWSPAILWNVAMGNYDADDNAGQLDDERGQFAWQIGVGFRFRPALAMGFDFAGHTVDFDAPAGTPPFLGSISDEYDLFATGMILSLAAESPRGPVRPFAAAGLGLYRVTLSRYGSLVGFPGTVAEEREITGGLHLSAGLAFMFNSSAGLTFEYRRLFMDADFGALTSGNVDVGGAMVLGGFRYVVGT